QPGRCEVSGAARPVLSVAFLAFPQDLRLRQHAARRSVAARAVSAQWIGAESAGPPRAERAAPDGAVHRLRRVRLRERRLRDQWSGCGATRMATRHVRAGEWQRRPRRGGVRHGPRANTESSVDRVPENLLITGADV